MPNVSLTVKANADNKKLTVACSLANNAGKKIYLFAALWAVKDGKLVADPHAGYASIDDKRMLHLGKIVHPLPKEKFVEQRYVPFALPVSAGGKWEEKLEFELPLQEYNPYYVSDDETQWDEVAIMSLQVCIDWFTDAEGLKTHETPIDGALRLEHRELLKRIERTTSEAVPIKAAGLRRTDKFERFAC
jgi:hypothetical protein